MKRELRIASCGLACCLCSKNEVCNGCHDDSCTDKDYCINRKCCIENGYEYCSECSKDCKNGMLAKIKPYAFTLFAKRYGIDCLLDCLEQNEKNGVIYHRQGIIGDYDKFDDIEDLIRFIKSGK